MVVYRSGHELNLYIVYKGAEPGLFFNRDAVFKKTLGSYPTVLSALLKTNGEKPHTVQICRHIQTRGLNNI